MRKLTVVLAIFTRWHAPAKPASTGAAAWLTVTSPPALPGDTPKPPATTGAGMFLDHGAVLGAAGVF